MSHRAFAFDEAEFRAKLKNSLLLALEDGEPEALEAFAIDHDIATEDSVPSAVADAALEVYYDPAEDIGLGNELRAARAALDLAYPEGVAFLSGEILPLHGWYVQSAESIARHLPMVEAAAHRDALNHEVLLKVATMLRRAQGRGLLVKS